MVAALYVETGGCYFNLPDVDPWDAARDARLYAGPHPVVAHPPCARWCRLAALVEKQQGKKQGDDGGCFASALKAVRTWGGVLEHPAWTSAWRAFGLPTPRRRGWLRTAEGGAVSSVYQGCYGHLAQKQTWLYAYGCELPALKWRRPRSSMVVTTSRRTRGTRREMPKSMRSRTPLPFRDVLLAMARSVSPQLSLRLEAA